MSEAIRFVLLYSLSITLARADSLSDILKRMDAAASQFKSMAARTKSTEYTKLVDHADEEYATLRMRRTRNGPDAVWEFSGKDPRVISLSGHLASRYFPRANTEERYNAARFRIKTGAGTRGDYTLVIYLDLQINPSLPDSAFQFKSPEGTKVIDVK